MGGIRKLRSRGKGDRSFIHQPSGTIETFKEGQTITLQDNVTLYSSLDIQKAVTIDKDSKITATSASTSNIHPASMIIGQDSDNKTYEPKLDICGTVSAVNMPPFRETRPARPTWWLSM